MANYGKRPDGTMKGTGWLGELKMQDGSDSVATELSAGYEIEQKIADGKTEAIKAYRKKIGFR